MRNPAPYAVVRAIGGTALRSLSTSLPLKMSGFLCGTFVQREREVISRGE